MQKLILALCCGLAVLPATAEVVTFDYTGVINIFRETTLATGKVRNAALTSVTPAVLEVGGSFRGSFSYDTAATIGADGYYSMTSAYVPASFITFDGTDFTVASRAQMPSISISNSFADGITVRPSFAPDAMGRFEIAMYTFGGTAVGQRIPGNLDLDDFDLRSARLNWSNPALGKSVHVEGVLTSIARITPVPEPETYVMLLAGLALVGGMARRRA